jgi:hypothetical protein
MIAAIATTIISCSDFVEDFGIFIVLKIISIQEDYDNALIAAYDLLQTTYLNTLGGIASR